MKPAILVTGLGRCGSSLTMQMLERAGVPCVDQFPAFEGTIGLKPIDSAWLAEQSGRAAKAVDPRYALIPPDANVAVIWLDRDHVEQARSQLKFGLMGQNRNTPTRAEIRAMTAGVRKDTRTCLALIRPFPHLRVSFERLVTHTPAACAEIRDFLAPHGFDLDPFVMAAARRRRDGHHCADDMAMEEALIAEAYGRAA